MTGFLTRHGLTSAVLAGCITLALWAASEQSPDGTASIVEHKVAERPADIVDIVVFNANIRTMDEGGSTARSMAAAAGKIICIQPDDECERWAGPHTETIDAEGRTILPGMIDTHAHFSDEVIRPTFPTLNFDGLTLEETLGAIRTLVREHPATPIVFGQNFDGDVRINLELGGPPRRELLDEVAPNVPVVVFDSSGYGVWFNSVAARLAGVDSKTPDPEPGVSFFTRDDTGAPAGWARQDAMQPFWALGERVLRANRSQELIEPASLDTARRSGITAYFDAATATTGDGGADHLERLRDMEQAGILAVRVFGSLYLDRKTPLGPQVAEFERLRNEFATPLINMGHLKIQVDSQWDNGAFFPDSSRQADKGRLLTDESLLVELLRRAHEACVMVHAHVIGDRATATLLDALEAAPAPRCEQPLRHSLAHVGMITDTDITRAAGLGVMASVTPGWARYRPFRPATIGLDPYWHVGTHRFGSMIRGGMTVVIGSDYPVDGPVWIPPFVQMEVALTRREPVGESEATGPKLEDRFPSIDYALRAYTLYAARMVGAEDEIGSLELGKAADFIITDRDPYGVPVDELDEVTVIRTVVAGRTVFEVER